MSTNTSMLVVSLEQALHHATSDEQKIEIKKIIHEVLVNQAKEKKNNFTTCNNCDSSVPNGEECDCQDDHRCKNCGFNDCYCCNVCGYRDAYSCYCNNFGQDDSSENEEEEYYNNSDDYNAKYGVCNKCEGNYKCDTGYGENRVRFLDECGKCPVCDSDPNYGDHQEWFEGYLGWELCEKCECFKDSDECKCHNDSDDESDDESR